ncbi:MAG: SPOR domain-containing protein [Acidobacteriota bacterium]
MTDETTETYFEIQLDRGTVLLLGFGFLALLGLSFALGRWTAPPSSDLLAVGDDPAETELAQLDGDDLATPEPSSAEMEEEEVDGEPMLGRRSVSVSGAPPIGEVPLPRTTSEPARANDEPTRRAETRPPRTTGAGDADGRSTTSSRSETGWVVQVAAVKKRGDARQLESKLTRAGYPVRVLEESDLYKVQVGPYPVRSEALAAERRLKSREKLATWVKRT